MTDTSIDATQAFIRDLERAIDAARQEYRDLDPLLAASLLQPLADQLYELRAQLDELIGAAGLVERAAPLWLRLTGGHVGEGRAPASAVGEVLESLQKAVHQVASYLVVGRSTTHRLSAEIEKETELEVLALAPGSARIALAASVPQLRTDLPAPLAETALAKLLELALWAEEREDEEEFHRIIPDQILRRQLANRLKELAPSPRGHYEQLDFSGPVTRKLLDRDRIRLTGKGFQRATDYLRRRETEEGAWQGQLVVIDIERSLLRLRVGPRRTPCRFTKGLAKRAKELIEAFVEIRGTATYKEDTEYPDHIDVRAIRRLRPEEQARLPSQ
jgi:hypothetical protein